MDGADVHAATDISVMPQLFSKCEHALNQCQFGQTWDAVKKSCRNTPFAYLLNFLKLQAQLKREGKEAAAQLVELQGQHQALQKQAHASSKVQQIVFDQHLLDVTSHHRIQPMADKFKLQRQAEFVHLALNAVGIVMLWGV